MNLRFPPPNRNDRSQLAAGFSIGPVVMVALTLLTSASLATTPPSPLEVEEHLLLSIPEPASMILGIFGLCLILLRRGRQ